MEQHTAGSNGNMKKYTKHKEPQVARKLNQQKQSKIRNQNNMELSGSENLYSGRHSGGNQQ